jgi:hypothetical protein
MTDRWSSYLRVNHRIWTPALTLLLLQEPHANERVDVCFIQQDANGPWPLPSLLAVAAHTLRGGGG